MKKIENLKGMVLSEEFVKTFKLYESGLNNENKLNIEAAKTKF